MIEALLVLDGLPITIVAFLFAIGIVVFIHEGGHYLAARFTGIEVLVFSVGFGPALLKWTDRTGTIWQLAALPVGGYVKFAENTNSERKNLITDATNNRGVPFPNASLLSRAMTVTAGPLANFIASTLIFAALMLVTGIVRDEAIIGNLNEFPALGDRFKIGDKLVAINETRINSFTDFYLLGREIPPSQEVIYTIERNGSLGQVSGPHPLPAIIQSVQPGSGASEAGLRRGDVILKLDGQPITSFAEVAGAVSSSDIIPLLMNVWRNGEIFDVEVLGQNQDLPLPDGSFDQRVVIGITGGSFFIPETYTPSIFESIGIGLNRTGEIISASVSGLIAVISGAISKCNIQGPIGIAQITGDAAEQGVQTFITLIAILSTAIGFVNLLPIPGLDGGHLAFNLYEAITRKKPSEKIIHYLMIIGFGIILFILTFGTINDLMC